MARSKIRAEGLNRRDFLKAGLLTGGVAAGAVAVNQAHHTLPGQHNASTLSAPPLQQGAHGGHDGTVGEVDLSLFDPTRFLYEFDSGTESRGLNGQTVREWNVIAQNRDIEIAPNVWFPAWTFNGQVPGPTFRCREGDLLRIHLLNASPHPHTIHFHGIHPPGMDGILPLVQPGETFVYEFTARPFGLQLYHCHVMPVKRHIHKGMYGAFVIDPPGGRPPAREMVMVMNAFDTNFDGENEVYAVNTVAFHHVRHPIQVKVGELIRVYLVNITEFDPVNSLHLHAAFYRLYRTGSNLDTYEFTDIVTMGQGERHVLEFTLDFPGRFMFHAHQSEFAELGWLGFFEAVEA
ncbi:MAG: multicopper oxidase domain-containing protein [Anaerolineales bacterium]